LRHLGKALTAFNKVKWLYRVGDYRILALIEDEKTLITLVDILHRKEIYELE